jgi:hypothetical protein
VKLPPTDTLSATVKSIAPGLAGVVPPIETVSVNSALSALISAYTKPSLNSNTSVVSFQRIETFADVPLSISNPAFSDGLPVTLLLRTIIYHQQLKSLCLRLFAYH